MKNNNKLIKKFTDDIIEIESKIKNPKLYNTRNHLIKVLIKSGMAIDYLLPFIMATIIVANYQKAKGNPPFKIDQVSKKAYIESIDTSNDLHKDFLRYEYNPSEELVEHSTKWITNEYGLYERTITSYRLDESLDINRILSMTKEEIEQALTITNIKTIKKNILTKEDSIYDKDAIIITRYKESPTDTVTRLETKVENISNTIWFIVLSIGLGSCLSHLEKIIIKTTIRDKLKNYEHIYKQIDKEEIEKLQKILKIKQENLSLIDNTNDLKEVYTRRLRKE